MGWKPIKNDVFIEVSRDYKEGTNERVYTRDLDANQVLDRRPVFRLNTRNLKYYVLNFDKVYDFKNLSKELKSLDSAITLNLSLSYTFQFQGEPTLELLHLFFKLNGSQKRLLFLNDWIDEFAASQSDFATRYFELKNDLMEFLTNKAMRLGLKLDLVIQEDQKKEEGYSQVSGRVVVRVKDYYGKIPLNYEIDLDIDPLKKSKATIALAAKKNLREKLERAIKRTIQSEKELDLQTMSFETNSTVRELIEASLEDVLKEDGLQLGFCSLEVGLKMPETRVQLNLKVNCITRNKHEIAVDHALILTLKDYGAYLSSGIKDIEKWAKEELERITQDYTFERNFTELIINFEDQVIKSKMREETEAIGFEIKQLILIPNLEKIIPNYVNFDTADYEFSLKMNDMKVKLNIIFNARIKDLSKIEHLISPKSNAHTIVKRIKDYVVNQISMFMHGIEPDDFYKYFDRPDDYGSVPIAEQLRNHIETKTEEQFGLVISDIICKSPDTELLRNFNKLIGHSTMLEIKNKTGTIDFKIPFDIIYVDREGWFTFKAKISALGEKPPASLLKDVKERIQMFVVHTLEQRFKHNYKKVQSKEFIESFAKVLRQGIEVVKDDFGLGVRYSKAWIRGASQNEKAYIEMMKVQQEFEDKRRLEMAKHNEEILKATTEGDLKRAKQVIDSYTSQFADIIDDPEAVREAYKEELKKLPGKIDHQRAIEEMNPDLKREGNKKEKRDTKKKKP